MTPRERDHYKKLLRTVMDARALWLRSEGDYRSYADAADRLDRYIVKLIKKGPR